MIRHCLRCGAEITACMGCVVGRDLVKLFAGEKIIPRELCGICCLKYEATEAEPEFWPRRSI